MGSTKTRCAYSSSQKTRQPPATVGQRPCCCCLPLLQNHLLEMDAKKAPAPTWETVRYMISCIQYGGRITDDFDQLLMDTFAEKYFHQGVLQVSLLMALTVPVSCHTQLS